MGGVGRLQYVRQSNPDFVFVHLSFPHCDNSDYCELKLSPRQ